MIIVTIIIEFITIKVLITNNTLYFDLSIRRESNFDEVGFCLD